MNNEELISRCITSVSLQNPIETMIFLNSKTKKIVAFTEEVEERYLSSNNSNEIKLMLEDYFDSLTEREKLSEFREIYLHLASEGGGWICENMAIHFSNLLQKECSPKNSNTF